MPSLRRKDEKDRDSIDTARERFLDAYATESPALLGDLRETVLPAYRHDRGEPSVDIKSECAASSYTELWDLVQAHYPQLRDALSLWARKYFLTHGGEPAIWVMETALNTLNAWARGAGRVRWHHRIQFYPAFPAGDPEYRHISSGESLESWMAEVTAIQILIPAWNRPGGEEESSFKKRFYEECDCAFEKHVKEAREWTERLALKEQRYLDGLAMWQAGQTLSQIHSRLEKSGLHVGGQDPRDSNYNSGIKHGLDRVAGRISIDPRKPA